MADIVGNVSRKEAGKRRSKQGKNKERAAWGRKQLQNGGSLAVSRAVRLRTPGLRQGFFGG